MGRSECQQASACPASSHGNDLGIHSLPRVSGFQLLATNAGEGLAQVGVYAFGITKAWIENRFHVDSCLSGAREVRANDEQYSFPITICVHSHELSFGFPVLEGASVKIADTALRRWSKVVS